MLKFTCINILKTIKNSEMFRIPKDPKHVGVLIVF